MQNERETTLELPGVADYVLRREVKERKAAIDTELEQIGAKEWRAYEQCNNEFRKQECHCQEQREVLRALEDLDAKERRMYELDHRKDQVMTICRVALANLAMWTRDQYFPASYAHATWHRLLPFFHLPGTITRDATTILVELEFPRSWRIEEEKFITESKHPCRGIATKNHLWRYLYMAISL